MLEQLISESERGISLMESRVLPAVELDAEQVRHADEYVRLHADYTAYHLLFALRRNAISAYSLLPASTKARVLCSALSHVYYLNDWGYLDPSEPHDGESAKALLETKSSALECLWPLLDDRRPAPLFGSEEATLSSMYNFRRCDFVFRYISLLRGSIPTFDTEIGLRDEKIKQLKEELSSNAAPKPRLGKVT